jgi:hypothetical protein
MASTVWGITPSSAATTRMTMSVTLAPRERMAEKGLMARRIQESDYPLIGFHMIGTDMLGNTAGLAFGHAGLADHVKQDVLPWSTWPMMVTTGGLGSQG